jgi:hypothetical protein
MNFIWNVVNLGTAVIGFENVRRDKDKKLNAAESLIAQNRIKKKYSW